MHFQASLLQVCASPAPSFLLQQNLSGVRLPPAPTAPVWSLRKSQCSWGRFGEENSGELGYCLLNLVSAKVIDMAEEENGNAEISDPSSWLLSYDCWGKNDKSFLLHS